MSKLSICIAIIGFAISMGGIVLAYFNRKERDAEWYLGWAMAIGGLLMTGLQVVDQVNAAAELAAITQKANTADKTARDVANDLAESQEKVANLLRINKEMAARMASRADILTPAVEIALLERFKLLPKKSVSLFLIDGTPESSEFWQALEQLMIKAGCHSGSNFVDETIFNPRVPTGRIVVQMKLARDLKVATTLRDALVEAGLPDVELDLKPPRTLTGAGLVQVLIKPK